MMIQAMNALLENLFFGRENESWNGVSDRVTVNLNVQQMPPHYKDTIL